jgi:uncharacterized membrane protein YkoI
MRFRLFLIFLFPASLAVAGVVGHPAHAQNSEKGERTCFSRAETHQRIHEDGLVDPLKIVRNTAGAFHAEALGAKLCKTDGTFTYEINLLDRDGRVIRATINAVTGAAVSQ